MKRLILLSLLIICSFSLSACIPNTSTEQKDLETQKTNNTEGAYTGNILDLINQNKDITCTWSVLDEDNNAKNSGQIYISGNKFRQDLIIEHQKTNLKTETVSVSDGEFIYIWQLDNTNEGMKMKLEPEDTQSETETGTGNINLTEKYNYQCSPWNVDPSKFNIPKNIKFSDINEMVNKYQEIEKNIPSINIPMPQEE